MFAALLTDWVAAAGQAGLVAGQAVEAVPAALAVGPICVASARGAVAAVARGAVQLRVKVALLGPPVAVARCKDRAQSVTSLPSQHKTHPAQFSCREPAVNSRPFSSMPKRKPAFSTPLLSPSDCHLQPKCCPPTQQHQSLSFKQACEGNIRLLHAVMRASPLDCKSLDSRTPQFHQPIEGSHRQLGPI